MCKAGKRETVTWSWATDVFQYLYLNFVVQIMVCAYLMTFSEWENIAFINNLLSCLTSL